MSESIEMYLVTAALLQQQGEPVPISLVAQELSVSPVSANEMCRKLVEQGFVDYQPYKGVTLTAKGETLAQRVLHRREIWEIFLTEKLTFERLEAKSIACRLEHVTPDKVAERLANFLETPHLFSGLKDGEMGEYTFNSELVRPLVTLTVGQRGQVVRVVADELVKEFLKAQGLVAGAHLDVVAVASNDSFLLDIAGQHLSLSRSIGVYIDVVPI